MKLTVSFFNNYTKYLIYLKEAVMIIIVTVTVAVVGTLCLNNSYISRNVITFATNIRQAEGSDITVTDIAKLYGIYNSDNYLMAKKDNKSDNKEEANAFDLTAVDTVDAISKLNKANLSIKNTSTVQRINVYGMTLLNYSGKNNIDILELFEKKISLTKKSDPIFIYATHTSESYKNSENFKFEYSGTYRTRNAKYNMLSVANEFTKAVKDKGLNVVFDTTPHDYGSYEIAYTNSRKTLNNAIKENGRFGIVIDMHRDAQSNLNFAPTVEVNGKQVAQLMFVMGIGNDSYKNAYWKQNLALAVQLQKLGEEMYPGLFRPMIIRSSKYNQDLMKNSFLIEVGSTGNTLEQAYYSARCLANILNKFYNN